MGDESVTPGGSHVERHREEAPHREASHDKIFGREIERHLNGFLGVSDFVFHEIVSDRVHIDILQYAPNEGRRFWTLVTSGMSDLPMQVAADIPYGKELQYAELAISLPEDWVPRDATGQLDEKALRADAKGWPLRWLTYLARFPHKYGTWLAIGHSIPNGDPPTPVGDRTDMTGFVFAPPITWPQNSWRMETRKGVPLTFMAIYPLYPEEMAFKLERGSDALFDLLFGNAVTEIVDPWRRNLGLAGAASR